jgi:hypothetical protein
MTNLSPTSEWYTSCEDFYELRFLKNVITTKLLNETFIEKLKTQIFILCLEKVKEKWLIFRANDFAAYIIEHVIFLATARHTHTEITTRRTHHHARSHL